MTALTWPEIKRRLQGLRTRIETERGLHAELNHQASATLRECEIEALDAVLSIEALGEKEPMG